MIDQTATLVDGSKEINAPSGRPAYRSLPNRNMVEQLEQRFGRLHSRQRLGIEDDHEARARSGARHPLRPRRWYLSPVLVRRTLKITGLYWWAHKNSERIEIRRNTIRLPTLPAAFDGLTILQISDLHVDINPAAMRRLIELLPHLSYDLCVLTGDYRGRTYGPCEATLEGMARMRTHITAPIYAVLGNHDSLRMVPALEEMGIRMLVNEVEPIVRDGQHLYLAGIDDAHFYRMDNIEKVASKIPARRIFNPAVAYAGNLSPGRACRFRSAASGHTHGGQICLPGSIALTLDFGPAAPHGCGIVAVWPHDRLHLGRGRVFGRRRQDQLPARDHAARVADRRRPGVLIGRIAQVESVKHARHRQFADKEERHANRDVGDRQRQWAPCKRATETTIPGSDQYRRPDCSTTGRAGAS